MTSDIYLCRRAYKVGGEIFTELSNFKCAAIFAYPSLRSKFIFDILPKVEGNLLQSTTKHQEDQLAVIRKKGDHQLSEDTHSNTTLAAKSPGLPDPNHSKFHRPSRKGDLESYINK